MKRFTISDIEIIENDFPPSSIIKRQIRTMLENSCWCSATVENVEKQTGKYRIVLEGQLGDVEKIDSSCYLG